MIYFSPATKIFYREKKGQLQRFSTTGDTSFKWVDSEFKDRENVRKKWEIATKEQIKDFGLNDRTP